jgi:predicted secreted Zn-dependent protease
MKPPVWKDGVLKVSYKTYDVEDIDRALNEQGKVTFKTCKSYNGSKEMTENQELFGREALEAAKKGIRSGTKRPTMRSEIIIGEGEERATRECELIWWPLYEHSDNGNLTVRIYIGKVII